MIKKIVESGRCSACGVCYAACPAGAISYQKTAKSYRFLTDPAKCSRCGLCLKTCPGNAVDFSRLNQTVFKKAPVDPLIGNFRNCYLCYSKNQKIRFDASSGGVVTSLLIYLLEKKLIDGALVTKMGKKDPLKPEVFLAYRKKEILEAMGSKYLPVPLNIGLKEILETKNKKFAVVGVPCHIQGIRKLQMEKPELRRKLFLYLGIFCGGTVSFNGTKFLLKFLNVKPTEVKEIRFRGEGWPGKLMIKTDKEVLFFPRPKFSNLFNAGLFVPPRCFFCLDFTNELADVSFGDAWMQAVIKKDKLGSNVVIARTKKGEEILRQAEEFISLKRIDEKKIAKAFWWRLYSKKNLHGFVSELGRQLGYRSPHYDLKSKSKINLYSFLLAFYFLNSLVTDRFSKLVLRLPRQFWLLYLKSYQLTYSAFWKLKGRQ